MFHVTCGMKFLICHSMCSRVHILPVVYLRSFGFDCNAFTQLNWPFGFNSIVSFVTRQFLPFSILIFVWLPLRMEKSAVWMNNVPCTNSIIWLQTEKKKRRTRERTKTNSALMEKANERNGRVCIWGAAKVKLHIDSFLFIALFLRYLFGW